MISWYHLDSSDGCAPNLDCSVTGATGEVYLPRGVLLASRGRRTSLISRRTCTDVSGSLCDHA
ncbi:MAG: hypothetical protein AB1817_22555, partial [Chloroflexota bacterium]